MNNKRITVKVGDILEIPLDSGKRLIAQYLFKDKQNGDLVLLKNLVLSANQLFDIESFEKSEALFRPVITSVFAAVKYHNWKIIGTKQVKNFEYPEFVYGYPGNWRLWNGDKYVDIGETIPKEYINYEKLMSYSPDLIVERASKKLESETILEKTTYNVGDSQNTFLNTYMFYGDHAADIVYSLEDEPTLKHINKLLLSVNDKKENEYLESPEASEALVAAEAIASLKNNQSPEATESFKEAMHGFKNVDTDELNVLSKTAIKVVKRIISDKSELKELWKESDEYNKWKNAANNLIERLA